MFTEKIKVNSNDVDCLSELKLSSLFKYLQQVATDHVYTLELSHNDLLNKFNLLWVILRMEVRIIRTPKLDEELTLSTHPGDQKAFIFPRFFQAYDKDGKLVITASSIWTVIDATTRKVSMKPEGIVVLGEECKDDIEFPIKINGEASSLVDTRTVRYSDIDMNGHLNNTQYIEYILDTHNSEFYKRHRIYSIIVNYDKEIKDGDVVALYSNNKKPEIIKGLSNNVNSFMVQLEYEER